MRQAARPVLLLITLALIAQVLFGLVGPALSAFSVAQASSQGGESDGAAGNKNVGALAAGLGQAHYRIGNDTALTAMTWRAAADTAATNIPRSTNFRVRFQVYNNTAAGVSWRPRLDYSATSGSGYAVVPTSTGTPPFFVTTTSQFTDGAAISTANFALGTGTGTARNGVAYSSVNPTGTSITLNANSYTEIEFNIQANANAAYGATYYFRLSNNGTALANYDVIEASVTIQLAPGLRQAHYRIGDDTPLTAMTWKATVDTAATGIRRSTNFRIRFQVYNNTAAGVSWRPRLDYSATSGSGYAAVPTTSGTAPFFVTTTSQFTNGAAISTANFALGTGTGTAQSGVAYNSVNPTGTSITLNANSYVEVEFNIRANTNAAWLTNYYFRLSNNGTALAGYDVTQAVVTMQSGTAALKQSHYRIGDDTSLTAMTWKAATDTIAAGIVRSANFRVRFQVYNDSAANKSWQPRLDWSATSGSGYAAVPTTSGATPFFVTDTTQFTNAASVSTANFALGADLLTAQNGYAYDTQNPAGTAVTLNANSYTEIEFNIQANANAAYGTSYYFRLTNNGTAFDSYVIAEASITIQTPPYFLKQAHYRIGDDAALSAMTWKAVTDVAATGIARSANFRVRFQVYNDGASSKTWQPQLEWTATSGSGFATLPTTSGAAPFFVTDTSQFNNAASIATANFGLGAGTGTAQNGTAYDTQNPAGTAVTLNANSYTEIEFNVQANANAAYSGSYYFRLTDAGTVFDAYVLAEAIITMQAPPPGLKQAHYRIGNDTALTAMTWKAATDTGATGIARSANFRIRFQVYNDAGSGSGWQPQLEWSAASGSGYAAVTTTSGVTPFFVTDTTQFTNAASIATANFSLGAGTGTAQNGTAYDTQNPAGTAVTLNASSYVEIEFNVQANTNAVLGTTYYFRLTNAGSLLTQYVVAEAVLTMEPPPAYLKQSHYRIGNDTALTAMTWKAATDTAATGITRSANFRVRFQVYNDGATNRTWQPQLEWTATSGSGYAALPVTSGTPPFFVTDTTQFTNAASIATANFALGADVLTSQNGYAYDTQNPAGASVTLNANSYTEIEFNIQANTNAALGTTYYFRLSDAGAAFDAYVITEAPITIQPPTVASYLRSTAAIVGSTTYNSLSTTRGATATTITSWIDNTGYKPFADTGPHGIFVSDAVPSGYIWTLSGTWTFNAYVRASSTGGTGNMLARIFEIDSSGNAFLICTTVVSTANALSSTTSTLVSWTDAIPSTVLNAGERYGVELVVKVTTGRSGGTGTTGIDGASGSNSDSNIVASYSSAVAPTGPATVKQAHYRVGNDTALTAMTWQGATEQRATNLRRGLNYRVRFQVYNDGDSAASWQPRLEWTVTSGSGYAAVPTVTGTDPFFVADTVQYANGASILTANFGLGAGKGTGANGAAWDAINPPSSVSLASGTYTEVEFDIQPTDYATYGSTYYFRLTDNGAALTAYEIAEAVVVMQPTPAASDPHNTFSDTTDKCATCHRTHTGIATSLRKATASEQALCFTCHNGTGSTTNIQAQVAKTVTGAPDTAQAGKHPAALKEWVHQTGETLGSQFSGTNRHAECEDCHKPHARFPGLADTGNNAASLVIANASGVRVTNTAAWTAPAYTFVTKISYEYELCLKCHSSWAYGASPPNAPSGFWTTSGTITTGAETNQAIEFNTLNSSHHAVEGPGANQPPTWSNPNWPDNGLGLSNNFVSPWTSTSTVQCGDCHARDTKTEPEGTHGSTARWMLRKYEGAEAVSSTAIYCYNCHRRDVYGDTNDTAFDNVTYKHSWTRFPHRWFLQQKTDHQSNTVNRWGIWCMSCHAGDVLGGIHGTNRAVGTAGATAVGKRFLNGAATAGWTAGSTNLNSGVWIGKGTTDQVNMCSDHTGSGIQWTANYNYMP